MSEPEERPVPRCGGQALMLGTVGLAAAAAGVLAVGAQDARLLRLGLVAALWAALLGAFVVARMRREINLDACRADELRAVYQLELEREVAARREHMLTVERELREQTEQAERREIAELRAELAAMRTNLEKLMDGNSLVERAEPARLVPMSAFPPKFSAVNGHSAVNEHSAVNGHSEPVLNSETLLNPCEDPELGFGPGRRYRSELDTQIRQSVEPAGSGDRPSNSAVSQTPSWQPTLAPWDSGISHPKGDGRHGTPRRESSGSNTTSNNNGHHNNNNGHHNNGGGTRRAAHEVPAVGEQRSVNDLLAAHGVGSPPRRRRRREDG
jgi:uncharacterized protein DUF6779